MSDSDLKEKEEAGVLENTAADFSPEERAAFGVLADNDKQDNEIPFHQEESTKTKKKGRFTRRQKLIGGGITTLIIGGGVATLSILQGPLQFIHIAQLLERFHFASVEDTGNSRTLKLYKFAKNAKSGTIENTRLGVIGNRIATKIDARMATIGLEKNYKPGLTAVYDGMTLNQVKFSENANNGGEFKGLSEQDFIDRFKESYGIDIKSNGDGTFKIPPEEGAFAYFKNHSVNKLFLSETGTDGIAGGISARIMGKRDGVTWHPIRRLDAKIVGSLDEKFAAWLAEMKARIKNGSDASITANGEKVSDADGNAVDSPDNNSGAAQVDDALEDAKNALADGEGSTQGLLARFGATTGGKVTLGATGVIGLVCTAKALSDQADGLKHDMIVLPLIRIGMQAISLGNQVMSGQDIDLEQLGFFAKQFNDPESGSWAAAKSIQAELGQEQTGPDIPDEANIKKISEHTQFSEFLNSIPALGITCSAANSIFGRAITFAVSLTTPIATLVTTAALSTNTAKDAIASVVRWMAGSPIPTLVFGPAYGNYINYGARLGSNNTKAALAGVALTPGQSAELRTLRDQEVKENIASEPFLERMFDPISPDSMVSKAIDNAPTSMGQVFANLSSGLANPLKILGNVFSGGFSKKVHAEAGATYDYGFPEIGYSLEDLNSDKYEDPYSNGDAVIKTLNIPCEINGKPNHPCGQDYIDKASFCFGVVMSPDGSVDSGLSASIDVLDKHYAEHNCSDPSVVWTQIRFYILDMKTAQSMDCFETNDNGSCQQVAL